MTIFMLVCDKASGAEGTMAEALAASDLPHLAVAPNAWLVADAGTAKQLGDRIGLSSGTRGTGIISEVGSYWGRAEPSVWSWIKQHWGTGVDG